MGIIASERDPAYDPRRIECLFQRSNWKFKGDFRERELIDRAHLPRLKRGNMEILITRSNMKRAIVATKVFQVESMNLKRNYRAAAPGVPILAR
jgi:hypothetical protein